MLTLSRAPLWLHTGLKNTRCSPRDRVRPPIAKGVQLTLRKKSVSEMVFSSALSRLSKQAENWEEPKTTAHLKIYHKVPAVTEAANKGVETASVGSTLQPENTEQGLKTRFSSQIQHCQKVQKNYFHWLLTINLLPVLLVDYFGGGEASFCSPQKTPFLLIIKEQISKTFRFF